MEKNVRDFRLRYNDLGFLEVANLPSPETLKAYYAKRYYQNEQGNYRKVYSEEELAYLNLKTAQKASIVDKLRVNKSPGSFLEVGCGEGFDLGWFASLGWSVEEIDYSIAGLEIMNPDLISYVESGDIFEILEFRISTNKKYDIVWLNNVLEHVASPLKLLRSLHNLITPDGILVVTVPNDGSKYQEFLLENSYISNRFWIAIPDHLAYFNYESLINTIEETGWYCHEIVADFPIDFFLLHPGSNYVKNPQNGSSAHQARVRMDLMLSQHYSQDQIIDFYCALANIGLGRNLTAFLSPKTITTDSQLYPLTQHNDDTIQTITQQVDTTYACMPRSILKLGSLWVQAVQPCHIEKIRNWRNQQMDVLRQSTIITSDEQKVYFQKYIWPDLPIENPKNVLLAYMEENNLIGYGGLVHIQWEHLRAEVSFLLTPALTNSPENYTRYFSTFLQILKDLAFEDLGLEKIFTETYALRTHHISILELVGFECEGVLKNHVKIQGKSVDSMVHGYLKQ